MSSIAMEAVTPNNDEYTCQHEIEIIKDAAGATPWVLIPKYSKNVLVMLDVESVAGEGRIEVTNDLYSRIKEDNPAAPVFDTYINEASGETDAVGNASANLYLAIEPVKAVRAVNVSGTTRLVVSSI